MFVYVVSPKGTKEKPLFTLYMLHFMDILCGRFYSGKAKGEFQATGFMPLEAD
jgi:hypothetical protein